MSAYPAFSVILPVYNVEEYLRECLDSLLAQTDTDWELIAVNDGSTDGSPAILEEYAAKDARLHLIHQANGGLSAARNAGLCVARGEYCLCVDSDDVVHPQLLEVCRYFLKKHEADMVGFDHIRIAPHAGLPARSLRVEALPAFCGHEPLKLTAQRHRHRISFMAPLSCCRTELARRHPFVPGLRYEDYPRTICLLRDVRTIVTLREPLYGYTSRPGSIMQRGFSVEDVAHYRRGLLCIAEAYAGLPRSRATVARIVFPEILKQMGNSIFRSDRRAEGWLGMLAAFRALLAELGGLGLLSWRGHKLRRYLAYRRLVATPPERLEGIVAPLARVFR